MPEPAAFRRRRRSRPARSRGGRRWRGRRSAGPGRRGTRCRSWRTGPRRGRRRRWRRRSRRRRGPAPRPLSKRRVAGELDRAPRAAPRRALQPPQEGEEDERGRGAGEQDEQHRDALVDGCLRGDVVGEAVVAGDREQRRQGAERGDRQGRQHPEPVAGEGEDAEGADREGEQAAPRVGEVEGHPDRRHRRDRGPAQRRPARVAAHPEQHRRRRSRTSPRSRSSSRAGSAAGGRCRGPRRPRARGAGGGSPGPEER